MLKVENIKEYVMLSGFLGFLSEIFASVKLAYTVLIALLMLDTATGILAAILFKKFTSRGLAKLVRKLITYSMCVLTVRLLEIGVMELYQTTLLSHIMVAFLVLIEVTSILENLTLLGAPLPANSIKYLLKYLKVPGLEKVIAMSRENEKDIREIEEIIKYQIPTIKGDDLQRLLHIKFDIWLNVINQLNNLSFNDGEENKELFYYRVMLLIKSALKEIDEKWLEEKLSLKTVSVFKTGHQPNVNDWLIKVKAICYSEQDIMKKKKDIIESIKILLYQTILDAHKTSN